MTREQILLELQQEYAKKRDEDLRQFEINQEEACQKCEGLRELLVARHTAVMHGVKSRILSRSEASPYNAKEQMEAYNRKIREMLIMAGLPDDFLSPVYQCPICRDEGYVYDPSRRMCECLQKELIRRLLEESGVGKSSASFESFESELFADTPDENGRTQKNVMLTNRDLCLAYAESYPNTSTHDLLLIGKSGLGKTFLLQCIAKRVAQRGFEPRYISANRFFEEARKCYAENRPEGMEKYYSVGLLLIDDLGTEPLLNNITVTQLFNLLNERQMAGLHTVISTNLSMSELKERYTERITSRLMEATRLHFIGEDVRKTLKRKGR